MLRLGRAPLLAAIALVTAGCAGRLSPTLHEPPSRAGLALLECYLYPEDPKHVRSKFAASDSFPARVAYLESVTDGHTARGYTVYGTGYVLFPDLEPGEYRLTRVWVETHEYSTALSRSIATDYLFRIPDDKHASLSVTLGAPSYLGFLSIWRGYDWEDMKWGSHPIRTPDDGRVSFTRSQVAEARAWTQVLAMKKYRRSKWREAIEKRLAEIAVDRR
jgi:hypothetical protein